MWLLIFRKASSSSVRHYLYNNDLAKSLQADQHFIWFAIVAVILFTIVFYRFTDRLAKNVSKLSIFAYKADHNESLEVEDLAKFPNDELGEIAERIIKMYKRIQTTRRTGCTEAAAYPEYRSRAEDSCSKYSGLSGNDTRQSAYQRRDEVAVSAALLCPERTPHLCSATSQPWTGWMTVRIW